MQVFVSGIVQASRSDQDGDVGYVDEVADVTSFSALDGVEISFLEAEVLQKIIRSIDKIFRVDLVLIYIFIFFLNTPFLNTYPVPGIVHVIIVLGIVSVGIACCNSLPAPLLPSHRCRLCRHHRRRRCRR